jgi:hypothetical protein
MMAQYDRVTALQQIHHHLEDQIQRDQFKRDVSGITKRANVFDFNSRLPGVSPVAKDINRRDIEISTKIYENKPHVEPWKCGLFRA